LRFLLESHMTNKTEKEYYASFVITSKTISADTIQNTLGLRADELREMGARISNRPGSTVSAHALWSFRSKIGRSEPIEKHVENLLDLIEAKKSELGSLRLECVLEIWCFVSFEESQCGFAFDHRLLRRIADLWCDLIFDVYH